MFRSVPWDRWSVRPTASYKLSCLATSRWKSRCSFSATLARYQISSVPRVKSLWPPEHRWLSTEVLITPPPVSSSFPSIAAQLVSSEQFTSEWDWLKIQQLLNHSSASISFRFCFSEDTSLLWWIGASSTCCGHHLAAGQYLVGYKQCCSLHHLCNSSWTIHAHSTQECGLFLGTWNTHHHAIFCSSTALCSGYYIRGGPSKHQVLYQFNGRRNFFVPVSRKLGCVPFFFFLCFISDIWHSYLITWLTI